MASVAFSLIRRGSFSSCDCAGCAQVSWWHNATVPRKIRDLIRELERVGFVNRGGKGSHRNFAKGGIAIVISGKPGDDAKSYQERDLKRATGGTP